MTHDEQRALLVEFNDWADDQPVNSLPLKKKDNGAFVDAFLAARQPPPARPLETTLYHAARGEPSAREGGGWVLDEPPVLPVDPEADALVAEYANKRATLCRCGHRRDAHKDWINNGVCKKCDCEWFTPPDAATLARQIEPADPALAAQIRTDAGLDGPQWYWRLERCGGAWWAVGVLADGTLYTSPVFSPPAGRKSSEQAEADGAASGLPEWKP